MAVLGERALWKMGVDPGSGENQGTARNSAL